MKIIDLLNKIANGELPNKTKFKVFSSCNDKGDKAFICEYDESYPGTIWCISDNDCKFNYKIDYMRILNYEIKLIEDQTIDIDSIEKLETGYSESGAETDIIKYINNKIVPCIKHLNKEIQSIKK